MSSSSDVTIRRATSADYDSVMDIDDNVYNGMDYLPSTYQGFLMDENCHMLLAEIRGKVVGISVDYTLFYLKIYNG